MASLYIRDIKQNYCDWDLGTGVVKDESIQRNIIYTHHISIWLQPTIKQHKPTGTKLVIYQFRLRSPAVSILRLPSSSKWKSIEWAQNYNWRLIGWWANLRNNFDWTTLSKSIENTRSMLNKFDMVRFWIDWWTDTRLQECLVTYFLAIRIRILRDRRNIYKVDKFYG